MGFVCMCTVSCLSLLRSWGSKQLKKDPYKSVVVLRGRESPTWREGLPDE